VRLFDVFRKAAQSRTIISAHRINRAHSRSLQARWRRSLVELSNSRRPTIGRTVKRFGWTSAPGDKVMQIENDYDKQVHNSDVGYIDDVDPDAGPPVFDGRAVPTASANSTC
jgi:ATP-dependent exoDNAse (exonuclease V) alpha subunit